MKIPAGIRHFPNSALLVAVDSRNLKGYLVKGDEATTIFVHTFEVDELQKEKAHVPTGDRHTTDQVFHDKVAKLGAEEVDKYLGEVSEVFIFVPAHNKSVFLGALSHAANAKLTQVVEGELTHETPVELAKRLML